MIAKNWNERGVPTVRGAEGWSYQGHAEDVLSPRHAGLRSHRDEIVGAAAWSAIIDRDTHERLVARLSPGVTPRTRTRSRLMTGLLFCGICGVRLYFKNGNDGVRQYRCVRDPGPGQAEACGRLSVVSGPLDEAVSELVIAAPSGPGFEGALASAVTDDQKRRASVERLASDEARLEELAADYALGRFSCREWDAGRG